MGDREPMIDPALYLSSHMSALCSVQPAQAGSECVLCLPTVQHPVGYRTPNGTDRKTPRLLARSRPLSAFGMINAVLMPPFCERDRPRACSGACFANHHFADACFTKCMPLSDSVGRSTCAAGNHQCDADRNHQNRHRYSAFQQCNTRHIIRSARYATAAIVNITIRTTRSIRRLRRRLVRSSFIVAIVPH
jgi:hypothetical protein